MTQHKTRLLIVDDEETIHKALKRTFRREPYELLHAYDAAEAWALLERHKDIGAIICDHYMPGTHGLDLLKDIRALKPDMVTILLTAQADLQLVMAAINEGQIHRFFTKPWDADQLRGELRRLVHGSENDLEELERMARSERKLRQELMLDRDEDGAFIIEMPD